MITLLEAQQQLQDSVQCELRTETIGLANAVGRVASADVQAGLNIPPSDNSAMDGFAVRAGDITQEGTTLPISQRIPAGSQPQSLELGSAARIFTGSVLPANADAVVIQENTQFDEQSVTVNKLAKAGDNVRPCGPAAA